MSVRRVAIIVGVYLAGIAGAATCLVRTQWTSAIAAVHAQPFHDRGQVTAALEPAPEPADVERLEASAARSTARRARP